MEPVTIVGIIVVFIGGSLFFSEDTPEASVEQSAVESQTTEDQAAFARGRYIPTDHGYYISNLSAEPVVADGCDLPVLVADLSNHSPGPKLNVAPVMVDCED